MKKSQRLLVFLLYFHKCVPLDSSKNVITAENKKVNLPCGVASGGNIDWLRGGSLLIRYKGSTKYGSHAIKDASRFNVQSHATSDLEVSEVQRSDSGIYTCQKDKATILHTVQLIVFAVSATPSKSLLSSEDLKLELSPEKVPGLQVHWTKDEKHLDRGTSLEMKEVDLQSAGQYWCHIKTDGNEELNISTTIRVLGSYSASSGIVYIQNSKPVILRWQFNFRVKSNEVKVVEGKVTYPSKVIQPLSINGSSVCWLEGCGGNAYSLDLHLPNPEIGDYQMEIVLEMEGRRKKLQREVCVANLTVSSSKDHLSMESTVTLLCQANCLDENGKLCWQNTNINREKCGPPGALNVTEEVTVIPETLGNWACRIVVKEKTLVSADLTLGIQVEAEFWNLSGYPFWVTIGVGVLILLLIVIIIVIVAARARRMRRARKRAWLIQNIHQQKRCVCGGFPIQRLKENV
ncbi:T-cell surface glycoprotein CD4-like [Lithobates pipiens]